MIFYAHSPEDEIHSMSETVFILGAGASKEAGAPLIGEFLDISKRLWKQKARIADDEFRVVFDAITKLQIVHSKASLEIRNIEEVFAAFEMAQTLGVSLVAGSIPEALVSCSRTVIAQTIEQTLFFPRNSDEPRVPYPPKAYESFAKLVLHLQKEATTKQTVSVITFNYDPAVEYCFHSAQIPFSYCLDGMSDTAAVPLLKLHGSLNWGECPDCERVVPWELSDVLRENLFSKVNDSAMILPISSSFSLFAHCKKQPVKGPFIVPPTFNKTKYHRLLSTVWSRAAKELSEAENIFVSGYSLQDSDAFFRYLYALGTIGPVLDHFWVFDPDQSGEVEARFRELLGTSARERFKLFKYIFSGMMNVIEKEFPGPRKSGTGISFV